MDQDLISVYKSSAPPFPTALQACPYNISLKEVVGKDISYDKIFGRVSNDQTEWFISEKVVTEIAEKIIEAISKNPKMVDRAQLNFEGSVEPLLELLDKNKLEIELPDTRMNEMLSLFREATKLYFQTIYWSDPANFALEVKGHDLIREKFIGNMKSVAGNLKESELSGLFVTLSNTTKTSFVTKVETRLLEIALIKDEKEKKKAITKLADQYYWLRYDYYGPVYNERMIENELADYDKLDEETIRERIDKNRSFEQSTEENLKTALAKTQLSDELSNVFLALRKYSYFYGDLKKQKVSKANFGLGLIVKELAKRVKMDETNLHYATVGELEHLLSGEVMDESILRDRRKQSFFEVSDKTYKFRDNFLSEKFKDGSELKYTGLIKGMSACSGLFVGKARVISNPKDCVFQDGEILVTEMTSVDFVPLMKKAGAIVTDRGGITSHAAIVSRELNVPCVIGTINATKTIKDGDTVEVNARHGVIKILSR